MNRIHTFPVVQLDAGEIHVGDSHQLVARGSRRFGKRLDERSTGTADPVETLCRHLIANDQRLDLGDAPIDDFQTQHEHGWRVRLANGAHQDSLTGLDIGDRQPIRAFAGNGVPCAVTGCQPLSVFRELDA